MQEHNQTIFFLEQLQPDWLACKQKAAYSCSIGLIFGLVGGLAFGLVGGLIFGQTVGLGGWLLNGLSMGVFLGLLNGLIYGQRDEPNATIQSAETPLWSWKKARFGLFIGLLLGLIDLSSLLPDANFGAGVKLFLVLGRLLIFGLSVALPLGLLGKPNARVQPAESSAWSWKKARFWLLVGLLIGLINALLNMLLNLLFHVSFNVPSNIPFIGQYFWLYYIFTTASEFGLYCFLISGLCSKLNIKIQPVEVLSWKSVLTGAYARLRAKRIIYPFCLLGILIGLSYLLPLIKPGNATIAEAIVMGTIVMLVFGLGFWLVIMLAGIVFCVLFDAKKQLPERLHLSPNEGVKRSVRNGLFAGLGSISIFIVVIGLIDAPFIFLYHYLPISLIFAIICSLTMGGLISLLLGLGAFIQHYTLRFWLWRSHLFPWQAVHFLDDATSRIFLRRTGGGYRFAHRLIRDSFLDS